MIAKGERDLTSEMYFLDELAKSNDLRIREAYAERRKVVASEIERLHLAHLRQQAMEAVAAKQWQIALGAWQAVLSVVPKDPSAHTGIRQARMEYAAMALRDGEYDDAIGALQAFLRLEPSSTVAQVNLRAALRARAQDAWGKGNWTRAEESWRSLLALTPPEPDAAAYLNEIKKNKQEAHLYQIAQQLLEEDNTAGAHTALEDLYHKAPHFGDPAGIAARAGSCPHGTPL